jgi:hypothetical protein
MAVNGQKAEERDFIVSYMFLRITVGWIGSLLPVVLLIGGTIIFRTPRPDSMSGYYYTHMRNIFVGALCALGVFLAAYDPDDDVDRRITNVAGLCMIGVAFCPTKPPVCAAAAPSCPAPQVRSLSTSQQVIGDLHLFFAAVTFIALALMALRFAKAEGSQYGHGAKSRREKRCDAIYRTCGITILSCVVLAGSSNLLPASVKTGWPLLFIFEALAVFAFGWSWFVTGQTRMRIIARSTAVGRRARHLIRAVPAYRRMPGLRT